MHSAICTLHFWALVPHSTSGRERIMKTTRAQTAYSPSRSFLTLFNLAQVLEIPLFPGFSRKLFKKSSIPSQSTFRRPGTGPRRLSLLCHLCLCHLSFQPRCTAVFCAVPRNEIFSLFYIFPSCSFVAFVCFVCFVVPSSGPITAFPGMSTFPEQLPAFTVFTFVSPSIHDFHAKKIPGATCAQHRSADSPVRSHA